MSVPVHGGVLPVDKPVGPTSHDIVARARRALRERRIGHTGTLDPFASGLLLLCVGPATRLSPFLTGQDKEYVARARLGVETDTLDLQGEVVREVAVGSEVTEDRVREALAGLTGVLQQVPPAFSAKKIRGEAAHRRVRRGETVELAPVEVRVLEMELLEMELPELVFRVRCSSGTYVRALARDLGAALGVGAHLTALRRTRVGSRSVEDAVPGSFDEPIPEHRWIAPLEALEGWSTLVLSPDEARRIGHGQRLPVSVEDGPRVKAALDGALLAVGEVREGVFHPSRVFPDVLKGAA